ncbi:hypothetical protein OIU78_020658 [Salix suchowensis]|nr:hypothetical protein OIU78_020658 [Salix suchowensis]
MDDGECGSVKEKRCRQKEGRKSGMHVQTKRSRHPLPITPPCVGFFTVHGVITYFLVIFLHPKIDSAAYQNTNQTCRAEIKAAPKSWMPICLKPSACLPPLKLQINPAWYVLSGNISFRRAGLGEDSRKNSSQKSSHSMHVEDGQRVVDALEERKSPVQHHHCVTMEPNQTLLPSMALPMGNPHQEAGCSAKMSVENGQRKATKSAANGDPPLKPVHPNHRNPAPPNM